MSDEDQIRGLPENPMLPIKQSAEILGVSVSTLYRNVDAGLYPPPIKAGKRARRYELATLLGIRKRGV